jgi:hypothetical protein
MFKTTLKSTVAAIALLATLGSAYPVSAQSLSSLAVKAAVAAASRVAGKLAGEALLQENPPWYTGKQCQTLEEMGPGLPTPDDVVRFSAAHPEVAKGWRDVTVEFSDVPKNARFIRVGGSMTVRDEMLVAFVTTDRNLCLAFQEEASKLPAPARNNGILEADRK